MSTALSIIFTTSNITCPPINCGAGGTAALKLKEAAIAKSADGSGWLIAAITIAAPFSSNAGAGSWQYVFTVEDSEVRAGQTVTASDIDNACCVPCDASMMLDKLAARTLTNFTRQSVSLYGLSDGLNAAEQILVGDHVAYRFHSAHLLSAVEIACDAHLAGYPYAASPDSITCTVIRTGPNSNASWLAVNDVLNDPIQIIVEPGSGTPLTARYAIVPPVVIPAGCAVGLNINTSDPEVHFGLQAHFDFQLIDPA